MIAQWAIESKWGEKPVGHANYFGIKARRESHKWCTVTTREGRKREVHHREPQFADYDSLEDSCRDYAWLITNGAPYHAARKQYQEDRDLPSLIAAVAHVYATDPGHARLGNSDRGPNERGTGHSPGMTDGCLPLSRNAGLPFGTTISFLPI